MNQPWYKRLLWWFCDKAGHFTDEEWVYNGYYHRNCKLCKRIVSEPTRND